MTSHGVDASAAIDARRHDYTHHNGKAGSLDVLRARTTRDIKLWHMQEFTCLAGNLKSIPEGEGTLTRTTGSRRLWLGMRGG